SPHFDCEGYDYTEYDTIRGPFRVVFDIPTALASSVLLALSILLGTVHWYWDPVIAWWAGAIVWWAAAIGLVVGLILLGLSLFLPWRKRTRCAETLKLGLDQLSSLGARPHIIAHSLGTYLVGRVLKKFPSTDLGNVVLVSTVLPRRYPWRTILAKR